jgi:hypothetical protein
LLILGSFPFNKWGKRQISDIKKAGFQNSKRQIGEFKIQYPFPEPDFWNLESKNDTFAPVF